MVSLWSSNTSMGEAGKPDIFSSVARSYLYSFLPVVPLEEGVSVSGYGRRESSTAHQ